MKNIITALILLGGVIAGNPAPDCKLVHDFSESRRDIKTLRLCLHIDDRQAIPEAKIVSLLTKVTTDFQNDFGLRFEVTNIGAFTADPTGSETEIDSYLRATCQTTQLHIIFCRKQMKCGKLQRLLPEGCGLANTVVLGVAKKETGFCIIYNICGQLKNRDAGKHPLGETVVKHELGHIFGLNHSNSCKSIMYPLGPTSEGQWLPEEREQIQKYVSLL